MNIKLLRVIFALFISIYLISGCATSRRRHKRVYTPRTQSHHVQVAKSMDQLDRYSKNTKPTIIYSYPKTKLPDNVHFVNLKPYKLIVVNEINRVRTTQGSGLVAWNPSLAKAANAHARDMASNNFLGHLGSGKAIDFARKGPGQGSNFYERIIFFGYPIKPGQLAGEILTYTKDNIVGSIEPMPHFKHSIENFLKSPAHAAILVNNRFTDVGVAAYRADNKIYWVIEFGEAGIGNENLR